MSDERFRTALECIAALKNRTLLADDEAMALDSDRAHQLGAVKAFNQAAGIAEAVLKGD